MLLAKREKDAREEDLREKVQSGVRNVPSCRFNFSMAFLRECQKKSLPVIVPADT